MASYVFGWTKNRADIRDGNKYKLRKWLVLEFHGSGHLQIILHLNKITECLKMTTFKIVFTFDVFFSAETTCTARWHVFYIRNREVSIYTTVVQLILLGYSHDRRAANSPWVFARPSRFSFAELSFVPSTCYNLLFNYSFMLWYIKNKEYKF